VHAAFAGLLGLYPGTLCHVAGSVRPAIACHAANNVCAVLSRRGCRSSRSCRRRRSVGGGFALRGNGCGGARPAPPTVMNRAALEPPPPCNPRPYR
jgi:hypothetical protein